jgi:hypothetical protein
MKPIRGMTTDRALFFVAGVSAGAILSGAFLVSPFLASNRFDDDPEAVIAMFNAMDRELEGVACGLNRVNEITPSAAVSLIWIIRGTSNHIRVVIDDAARLMPRRDPERSADALRYVRAAYVASERLNNVGSRFRSIKKGEAIDEETRTVIANASIALAYMIPLRDGQAFPCDNEG